MHTFIQLVFSWLATTGRHSKQPRDSSRLNSQLHLTLFKTSILNLIKVISDVMLMNYIVTFRFLY